MSNPRRKVCKECGEVRSVRDFYKNRGVCKECVGEHESRAYTVRTRFQEAFICRQCGRPRRAEQASSYANDLCKACHSANLLARKAKAPSVLRCRFCGEKKPKEEFERYSITRCKACAAHIAKERKEKFDE
jgi:hypothetical protein